MHSNYSLLDNYRNSHKSLFTANCECDSNCGFINMNIELYIVKDTCVCLVNETTILCN